MAPYVPQTLPMSLLRITIKKRNAIFFQDTILRLACEATCCAQSAPRDPPFTDVRVDRSQTRSCSLGVLGRLSYSKWSSILMLRRSKSIKRRRLINTSFIHPLSDHFTMRHTTFSIFFTVALLVRNAFSSPLDQRQSMCLFFDPSQVWSNII